MGLSRWLHWMAWYFKYFVFLSISCGIMTVLLCVKFDQNLAVINSSDSSVIFVWLLLYTSNIISFCFLISTLFSKGQYQFIQLLIDNLVSYLFKELLAVSENLLIVFNLNRIKYLCLKYLNYYFVTLKFSMHKKSYFNTL